MDPITHSDRGPKFAYFSLLGEQKSVQVVNYMFCPRGHLMFMPHPWSCWLSHLYLGGFDNGDRPQTLDSGEIGLFYLLGSFPLSLVHV
jgi:hypothetical protein